MNGPARLVEVAGRARQWLEGAALPLWGTAGFDAQAGMFHEQLAFDGTPRLGVPRRLMVQARQVSVFARAALEDATPGAADRARVAGQAMIARYLRADGAPGWVFSLAPDGRVASPVRDLYAHAFVLYGLSWLHRLGPSPVVSAAVGETLAVLDGAFRDPVAGGFWDRLPEPGALRSQNPHMHLFEALIALYEATGDGELLERCRALDALARARFLSADQGWLREDFAGDWSVMPEEGAGPGAGRVEPGHMLEWAFLLRRFEAVSGEDRGAIVADLVANALACGVDPVRGRIVDEVAEGGAPRKMSSRCWPHAEALKALAGELARGRAELAAPLAAIAERLLILYCPAELNGGWRDQMDADDRPVSAFMPASTLYHVHGGFKALEDAAGLVGAAHGPA